MLQKQNIWEIALAGFRALFPLLKLFSCSFSSTKAALTVVGKAARYSNRATPGDGLDKVVSLVKYCFRSSKACCC